MTTNVIVGDMICAARRVVADRRRAVLAQHAFAEFPESVTEQVGADVLRSKSSIAALSAPVRTLQFVAQNVAP